MLNGRNIIVFGDDWNRFPSTLQHLCRVFLAQNRVMWIGSLGLRKPRLTVHDMVRVAEKARRIIEKRSTGTRDDHLMEVHPIVVPAHDIDVIRRMNMTFVRRTILKNMGEAGFTRPILLTSSPLVGDIVGTLGETSSHYFCLDDYAEFEGSFKCLPNEEQKLLAKVDSSFSVSEALKETRIPKHGTNNYLPQGVDTDHFRLRNEEIPHPLKGLRKPVVGFFGMLAPWVNIELMVRCAQAYPDINFVVIARSVVDTNELRKQKNVLYLGEIPYTDLPRYASAFDVGLIPFRTNELTKAANPLKLLEYLSLGIPVLTTLLPEAKRFENVVLVARDEDEFVRLIPEAIRSHEPESNGKRRMKAEEYSWIAIADEVSRVIEHSEMSAKSP